MSTMASKVDAIVQAHIPIHGPGVAVAIIQHEHILHCQGYGLANLEWEQPITPATVFGIGSITKPFTATAILLLEQQGKLSLDDPIQRHLPDYPTHGEQITMQHLLTHTSGIPNFVTREGFWQQHAPLHKSFTELTALFQHLPLDFAPGTRYGYSNSAYCLLGKIIENLSGMSYGDFIQTQVFAPMGMTCSHYISHEPIIARRAGTYEKTETGYQHAPNVSATQTYSAGGLGSTLEDFIHWEAALREERLLDRATQERMYTPVQLVDGRTENYGLGWALNPYRRQHVVCHAGGIPGYSAFFGRFMDYDTTLIVLSNIGGFDGAGLARKLSHLVLDLPELVHNPITLDPTLPAKISGTYHRIYEAVQISPDAQTITLYGAQTYHLVPTERDSFYCAENEDIEISFEQADERGYQRVRIVEPFFWFTADKTER
ncbi:MAG TPA: serine hydrolase domain-containing protein [Ktedonobacteraceae bacterium]|nr:serine hydrolase domain-containing protein [Ktedonobacteraceae bacterium]